MRGGHHPLFADRPAHTVGWDQIEIGLGYDDGATRFSTEGQADDVAYAAELGYNFAVRGSGILGAYAGVELSGNKVCTPLYGVDEGCISAGRNLAVGVRSGLRVGPQALVYVKGGYSNGKVELTYRDYADSAYNLDVGRTRDGYHLGAGGEFAFAGNAYGKAEYVYTSYNGYAYDDGEVAAGIDSAYRRFSRRGRCNHRLGRVVRQSALIPKP